MSFLEILLIAVGLCFDTLAVSMVGGACISCIDIWKRAKILLCFAFFQGGLTFAGWVLGSSFSAYISAYDHWVAFLLLLYIGGKMVVDSLKKDETTDVGTASGAVGGASKAGEIDLLNTRTLVLSSIATSIDAAAVGISFACLSFSWKDIISSCLVIAVVTALAAYVGLAGGEKLGKVLGKKCDFLGGLILVSIGVKILLEHLL